MVICKTQVDTYGFRTTPRSLEANKNLIFYLLFLLLLLITFFFSEPHIFSSGL